MEKEPGGAEELYAKAFNHGYFLQRFEPELANKISATHHVHNIYLQTFNEGREAYLEEVRERIQSHQKEIPKQDRSKGMERER